MSSIVSAAEPPVVGDIAGLRRQLDAWRRGGQRIAFVPTMGSLHEGHLALVSEARRRADRVVVSIFVNPLQFAAGEDFSAYPRSLEADRSRLAPLGVDLLFAPSEQELYPRGREGLTQVIVPGLSGQLCGAWRDGHFEGVTTVVSLLFHVVQPDVAVFGEKDYQQLAIIRRMVSDLHFPVEVVGVPTAREASGLALSSRNVFLSPAQRKQAARIHQALQAAARALQDGRRDFSAIEEQALQELRAAGLEPQFFEIRQTDLRPPDDATQQFVILTAARLGSTRLIDNLSVNCAGA